MLWAVKFFFLAGALLVLQSVWAFVDGIRFLGLIRRRQNSPRGKLCAGRCRGDSLQGSGRGI